MRGLRRLGALQLDGARQRWDPELSGTGPAPAVVSVRPSTPEPAPPEPTVVPPGPPPVDKRRSGTAQRSCDQAGRRAQRRCAGLGAQNIGVRNVQVVAGDGDVVVVLNRQRNRIGEAQIDLAVLHQVGQPHRIGEARLWNGGGAVDIDRIAAASFRTALE